MALRVAVVNQPLNDERAWGGRRPVERPERSNAQSQLRCRRRQEQDCRRRRADHGQAAGRAATAFPGRPPPAKVLGNAACRPRRLKPGAPRPSARRNRCGTRSLHRLQTPGLRGAKCTRWSPFPVKPSEEGCRRVPYVVVSSQVSGTMGHPASWSDTVPKHLAKVEVAGSDPVVRSTRRPHCKKLLRPGPPPQRPSPRSPDADMYRRPDSTRGGGDAPHHPRPLLIGRHAVTARPHTRPKACERILLTAREERRWRCVTTVARRC